MVTNYLQLTAAQPLRALGSRSSQGPLERVFRRLGQFLCGLKGHDPILHFEERRMFLRCTSCGYDSPGWELGNQSPRLLYHGVSDRHVLQKPARSVIAVRNGPVEFSRKKSA